MLICDLCRKKLIKGESKWVEFKKNDRQICDECIKTCNEIIKDRSTGNLVYLNEYKEAKERK